MEKHPRTSSEEGRLVANNTSWQQWGPGWGQITPVPEPSTYGALFMGLCTAFIAFRRFFGKKQN